jgi:hypothetical protein
MRGSEASSVLTTFPSFGIFRLTDPPGLQTILDCTAKEAFHPHPDVPIYTVSYIFRLHNVACLCFFC